MPSTARGVPYPAPGAANNVPADLLALAGWVNDAPGVAVLTTTQRDALAGAGLWDGREIYNSTLDRVQVYDLASTSWKTVPIKGDYLEVLGYGELASTTVATLTTTSTTPVDTGISAAFTVPASGVVYVELEGIASESSTAGAFFWSLREATTDLAGTERRMTKMSTQGGVSYARALAKIRVAGLTPGAAKTWKWAHRASAGTLTMTYGGSANEFAGATGSYGPASMRVIGANQ